MSEIYFNLDGRAFMIKDGTAYYLATPDDVKTDTCSVWLRCGVGNFFTHPDTNKIMCYKIEDGEVNTVQYTSGKFFLNS